MGINILFLLNPHYFYYLFNLLNLLEGYIYIVLVCRLCTSVGRLVYVVVCVKDVCSNTVP